MSVRTILGPTLVTMLGASLLGGCAGNKIELDGRAVQGRSSIFLSANEFDSRLSATGATPVAGAEITLRGRNHDGPVLATATAGPDGRFSLTLPDAGLLRSELALTGRLDGYLPARTVMFAPPRGSSILLVLEPTGRASSAPAVP
jgi:hypothetical protein